MDIYNKLPIDLKRNIMSFGYHEHRKSIELICKSIKMVFKDFYLNTSYKNEWYWYRQFPYFTYYSYMLDRIRCNEI